mmetsp:Transcript_2650/g.4839  ORF Transcript_2650/g.4839 Transcript_2650/m.4839 type:complete len:198 (+) Transcript_2650:53-646(+)|eukprot:CAMPEP_0114428504 /NCGR_PEP_ID=MMETSP0103-20121206/8961_1 /TAXON_ID=37642 ORGANISM="Paraphysomonas imperforata, Strain PA2" /NCGR_SAMPLE_ID=MMETSP0103 /ASSEMBLY_ACC=CAM_ASM_000201 /LENGTH=197 /DNA_ID=CAMNT_0001597725 /DNA_START=128 /DNA_END=718 /DNA_ORIENTATION=-
MSLTREFFKKIIPAPIYNLVRNAVLFRPEDPVDLWQQPPQMKNTIPGYDEMKGYRYPAPGSVPRPNISSRLEDPYDNKKFSRNLDNLEDDENYTVVPTKFGDLTLEPTSERVGSKYNNIPAVYRYDETGLRCTMTATWEAMDKELQKIHMDHLPQNGDDIDEVVAMYDAYETRGRPVPCGPVHKWDRVSSNYNSLRW